MVAKRTAREVEVAVRVVRDGIVILSSLTFAAGSTQLEYVLFISCRDTL